jgi:hypothetical protein
MKRTLVLVILVSLVASVAFISGCTLVVAQTTGPYTYSSEVYSDAKASPTSEQEVLNFLAGDPTDKNLWIYGVYECGHFAADLWWDAYMQGLEACMVWVKHRERGTEQDHWVVKFHIEDTTHDYWLWIEPSSDEAVDEGDYTIQDTFCGGEAFRLCENWRKETSR